MSQIKDMITIDKRFQSSINIQLDIDKQDKIDSYIPTRSSVAVLAKYLLHVLKNTDKANVFIGPYGKGKSHLLLILIELLSQTEDKLTGLIDRIANVDIETAEIIRTVRRQHRPFLPVIVSGSTGNLQQAFIIGLTDALKRKGLEDIAPASYYSEAIRTIDNWKKNFKGTYKDFEMLLAQKNIKGFEDAKSISNALRADNALAQRAYDIFIEIYPLLTAGASFNPIVEIEILKLYKDMKHILCEEYGYGGIYIIFDEFSKYIEGYDRKNFSRDMHILQDICELAQNSGQEQLHITMVAHKSIREYGNTIPREMLNAYMGVEGRIKEESFIVSAENNYEIIAQVIKKDTDEYKSLIEEKEYIEAVDTAYDRLPGFKSILTKEEYKELIVEGCFPLLPITAYSLLSISEKVAQNERSIFTFLASEDEGALPKLIERLGDDHRIKADVIYDYFKNLFRENMSIPDIHAEWLKADYALGKCESDDERRMVKCLAILRMIKKNDEIPVNDISLRLASGMTHSVYESTKKALLDKQLILYRVKLNAYAFKNNVGVDIDREIREIAAKKQVEDRIEQYIADVADIEYELPKQYNQQFMMTRYFRYVFMQQEQFFAMSNANYIFREKNADGSIIAIVWEDVIDRQRIEEHLRELDDQRIVVILPERGFSQKENLRKLLAVKELLGDESFIEQNKVLKQELELYIEDISFEINAELEALYIPGNANNKVFDWQGEIKSIDCMADFNRYLSGICMSYYASAPKINNELINRQNISKQVRKARGKLLNEILEEKDMSAYVKGTSPEATIYRAVMLSTGIMSDSEKIEDGCASVLEVIDRFIEKCSGEDHSFSELYAELDGENYGVRRGVVPMFMARQLMQLNDMPVIYLEGHEVSINDEILANINDRPQDYSLYIEQSSMEKQRYLESLEEIFLEEDKNTFVRRNQRLERITDSMQRWLRSLPQYALTFRDENALYIAGENIEGINIRMINRFRKIFHEMQLNPRDILFEKLPYIFGCGFSELAQKIRQVYMILNRFLEVMERQAAYKIKNIFEARQDESLYGCLKQWYKSNANVSVNRILNEGTTRFMVCIEGIDTHDELEIVQRISKTVLDVYTADWNDRSINELTEKIGNIREDIESNKESGISTGAQKISFTDSNGMLIEKYYETGEEDSTSSFLSNAIEAALEEFEDSLEINQKVSVLVQALERLIRD